MFAKKEKDLSIWIFARETLSMIGAVMRKQTRYIDENVLNPHQSGWKKNLSEIRQQEQQQIKKTNSNL